MHIAVTQEPGLGQQLPSQTLLITVPQKKDISVVSRICNHTLGPEVTSVAYIHTLLPRTSHMALPCHKEARKCSTSVRELQKYLVNSTKVQ